MNKHLRVFLIALNIVLAILMVGAYVSPYVHPKDNALIPILGLGFPALLLSHLIAIGVWLVYSKKLVLISGLTLLIGIGSCNKIFTISIPDRVEAPAVTVASFNVNFSKPVAFQEDAARPAMEKDFETFLASHDDINILCLQENGWRSEGHISAAMSFPYVHKVQDMTVAILSKFPFVDTGIVDFNSNIANTCLWADVDLGRDTIRVYCTHLESNRSDGKVPQVIEQEAPEAMSNSALAGIVLHYQKFSAERVKQAERIIEHSKQSPYKIVICGDINDTPQSYVYSVLKADLQDTFVEEGQGMGSSFGEKIPALRIDHIFVDERMQVLDHEISRNVFSDHYLIRSVFKI